MILASGAKQLVVQEAFETISISVVYPSSFTPITKSGTSSFGGAERTTFLAPPAICLFPPSLERKTPVDSHT